VLITKCYECLSNKVGDIKCRGVIEGKVFAERNGSVIQDFNLIGNMRKEVVLFITAFNEIRIACYIFIVLFNKFRASFINILHLRDVIAEGNGRDYGFILKFLLWGCNKPVKFLIKMALDFIFALILPYFFNPLLYYFRNFIL
jgi:hypothetical protein